MRIGFLGGKLCVEKWWADVLQPLLCCPVAVLLRRNHSKSRHSTAGKVSWKPQLGLTVGGLRLIVGPADTASTLVFSSSSLVKSVEVSYPHGGITRNDFVHLIHFSPLEEA